MATASTNRHVALYLRISLDKTGKAEGVDAQERQGRRYAAETWHSAPVVVYSDNDLSAAKDDVERPAFERLREAVRAGRVAHVWAVEQSRITRREVEWFTVAAEMDAAGIPDLHTRRDGILPVHDIAASIRAVVSAGETRKLQQRTRDALADRAERGQPSGGAHYGYVTSETEGGTKTLAIVPEQAEVIRETADRVLRGWPLAAVARDLDARAIRGARGGVMGTQNIFTWLTAHTTAGLRLHHDEEFVGNWPGILDVETWRAVRDTLKVRPRGARRRYLLSSILACAECSTDEVVTPVTATQRKLSNGKKIAYAVCRPRIITRSCVGINYQVAEDYVLDELWRELDSPAFREALAEDGHEGERERIAESMQANDGKRKTLARQWAADELTDDEWTVARETLDARERELRAQLDVLAPAGVSGDDIDEARSAWPWLALAEQREFVRLFICRIWVTRTDRGRWAPPADRLTIEWRMRASTAQ